MIGRGRRQLSACTMPKNGRCLPGIAAELWDQMRAKSLSGIEAIGRSLLSTTLPYVTSVFFGSHWPTGPVRFVLRTTA
jgi:hypothetical protein